MDIKTSLQSITDRSWEVKRACESWFCMLARLDYGDQLLVTVSTLIAYSKPVSSVQLMYPFYRCTNYPTVCDITIFPILIFPNYTHILSCQEKWRLELPSGGSMLVETWFLHKKELFEQLLIWHKKTNLGFETGLCS